MLKCFQYSRDPNSGNPKTGKIRKLVLRVGLPQLPLDDENVYCCLFTNDYNQGCSITDEFKPFPTECVRLFLHAHFKRSHYLARQVCMFMNGLVTMRELILVLISLVTIDFDSKYFGHS